MFGLTKAWTFGSILPEPIVSPYEMNPLISSVPSAVKKSWTIPIWPLFPMVLTWSYFGYWATDQPNESLAGGAPPLVTSSIRFLVPNFFSAVLAAELAWALAISEVLLASSAFWVSTTLRIFLRLWSLAAYESSGVSSWANDPAGQTTLHPLESLEFLAPPLVWSTLAALTAAFCLKV